MADKYTYKIHSVEIESAATGAPASALVMPDVISQELTANQNIVAELSAGSTHPQHVAVNGRKLLHRMSTFNAGVALAYIGPDGLAIDSDVDDDGLTAYLAKYNDVGQLLAAGNHMSVQVEKGLIYPTRLTCDHQGDARLDLETAIILKDTNDIITVSHTATLPTITEAAKRYTLGGIKLGNAALAEFTRLEIDFGNQVETGGAESSVDDDRVMSTNRGVRITITGIDPTWLDTALASLDGRALAHATDYIYLRARENSSADHYYENTDAQHCKLTFAGLGVSEQLYQAEANRVAEDTLLLVLGVDSSGNAPLTVTDDSQIS